MIYLDHAATTKVDENVAAFLGNLYIKNFGNASAAHKLGEKYKKELLEAKNEIAGCLGCNGENIIFTSGASESNNTAIANIAARATSSKKRVLVSPIEHPSVLEPLKHYNDLAMIELDYLHVNEDCVLDMEELKEKMSEDVLAVVVMSVNSETGAIQPIGEISDICRKYKAIFFCDFVQGFGKIHFHGEDYDFASFSAHKVYGPKGIGMLYVKSPGEFRPLIFGGGQQSNFRSGTEPVELIKALALTVNNLYSQFQKNNRHIQALRSHMQDRLCEIAGVDINSPKNGVPHILNVCIGKVRSDSLALVFHQNDIMLSQGSACSSNHEKKVLSHVLLAMGLPEERIRSSFRISFGKVNTMEEVDRVVEVIEKAVNKYKVSR